MPAPIDSPLVQAIRAYLDQTGMSARALSLRIGRNEAFIRQVLIGRSKGIHGDTQQKLAEVMNVPMETLSGGPSKASSLRLPGRKPGPAGRAELLAIWDALDDERRKGVLFVARAMAKDAGLPGGEAPLLLSGAGKKSEGDGDA